MIELIHFFLAVVVFLFVTPSHHSLRLHRTPENTLVLFGRPKNKKRKKNADNFLLLFKQEGMLLLWVLLGPAPFSSQPPKKESRRSHSTHRTPLVYRELLAPVILKSARALPFYVDSRPSRFAIGGTIRYPTPKKFVSATSLR